MQCKHSSCLCNLCNCSTIQCFCDVYVVRYCAQFELTETRPSCMKSPTIQWSKSLTKGASLCVECQALVMKDPQLSDGRCRGHGILNRETRWSAVAVPGCHGKWVMKTPHAECQCDPEQTLSFVLVWTLQCRSHFCYCSRIPDCAKKYLSTILGTCICSIYRLVNDFSRLLV
jgi:hypothetical protein